jgi:hypothetical protein
MTWRDVKEAQAQMRHSRHLPAVRTKKPVTSSRRTQPFSELNCDEVTRRAGFLIENMVARRRVESPPTAFSGLRALGLTAFLINNLTRHHGRFIVTIL